MKEGPTLLLLGADGFLGTHLDAAARAVGLRVVGAARRAGYDLQFDLTDPDSVGEAVRRASPDLVVNMAGLASVAESWRRPSEAFTVNATGVVNLLEAVARHAPGAHVTCLSSADVYAPASEDRLPLREEAAVAPLSPYGASKAAMEIACGQYARSRELEIAVIRGFNQLGPRQSPQFVASDFARQVAAAEIAGEAEVELSVGNLSVARDFTDVRDSSRAYVAVAQRRLLGTFNLCSGKATELKTLIDEIKQATPVAVVVTPRQERSRLAETAVIFGSAERIHEATGWAPRTPLQQTVRDLMEWWRSELRRGRGVAPTQGTGVSS